MIDVQNYVRRYARYDIDGSSLKLSPATYLIATNGGSIRVERGMITEEYMPFAPYWSNVEFLKDMPQFLNFCKNPPVRAITSQRSYSKPDNAFTHFNVSLEPGSTWAQDAFKPLAGFTEARGLKPTNICVRWDASVQIDNVYLDFYGKIPYEKLCREVGVDPQKEAELRKTFDQSIESVMIYWTPLNGGKFRSWLYEFLLF